MARLLPIFVLALMVGLLTGCGAPERPLRPPAPPAGPAAPPAPGPGPAQPPGEKPTLAPGLTPACDLTGTWTGTGVYYQLHRATGERIRKVTADVTMTIVQTGGAAAVTLNTRVVKQEPGGRIEMQGGGFRPPEQDWVGGAGDLQGTVSSTSLHLAGEFGGFDTTWDFTFTTDLLSGGFKQEQDALAGWVRNSDPKGFVLTRQKS